MSEIMTLSNDFLKGIMADALVMRIPAVADFNEFTQPGMATVRTGWQNFPFGSFQYGTVVNLGNPESYMVQVYFPDQRDLFYWRTRWCSSAGVATWRQWKYLTGTELTS